jgi:hypothetical protein
MTYFLFSDREIWHKEILALTWREALQKVRNEIGVGGRLRICAENYDARDYHLDGTSYAFTLRKVN